MVTTHTHTHTHTHTADVLGMTLNYIHPDRGPAVPASYNTNRAMVAWSYSSYCWVNKGGVDDSNRFIDFDFGVAAAAAAGSSLFAPLRSGPTGAYVAAN